VNLFVASVGMTGFFAFGVVPERQKADADGVGLLD
jgi:hypothetical protein